MPLVSSSNKTVAIVGPFPPPRHGVSGVNQAVAAMGSQAELAMRCFDTAPRSLQRSFLVRLGRLGRFARAAFGVWRFSMQHPGAPVYFSLSGGWGLLYEAVCIAGTRCLGGKLVVHHHSFRYLDAAFWPMALLVRAAGAGASHVVLGPDMAECLRARYPAVGEVLTLSNAIFLEEFREVPLPTSLVKVGYLANLSSAKGLDDVLDTIAASNAKGLALRFVIAGPFEDRQVERNFRERVGRMSNLEYVGPVYGAAKETFYHGIDMIIFPTRYVHEAEPLVVLEAMSRGRPVVAYGRGCIPALLAGAGGLVVHRTERFADAAVECIARWLRDEREFVQQCESARRSFTDLRARSHEAGQILLSKLGAV